MNLRTSCFNSAVFRSDVKRLWWVPALHTLSIFLLCLLPFYIDYHEAIGLFGGASEQYINSALFQCSPVPYIILGILTVGISVLLFSYLNSKSAVATMHAVPVKRKTLYITHIVFGLIALIVPILINGGILVIMRSNPNIAQVISMSHIGAWISTQIAYAVVGFAFSVLIGMFTGNSVAHLVFTYIFAVLPFLVEAGLKYIMYLNLYGYVMNDTNMAVAKYLESVPYVKKVYYPGLESHPQHEVAKKMMHENYGGIMSFELQEEINGMDGFEACKKVINELKIASIAVSLGDPGTLVQHPASMTHANMSKEARAEAGIKEDLIRLSVGLENSKDIIEDFKQAFATLG